MGWFEFHSDGGCLNGTVDFSGQPQHKHQHPEALTFASKDGLDEASSWGMGIMNHWMNLSLVP